LPFWGILHNDNELGDAIRLQVVLHHVHAKQYHVEGMKPSAVGIKEGHDVDGRDLRVEGVGVFEVTVPNLINNITEKLGHTLFGRLVTGVVIKSGFVGSLRTNLNDCCGIVSDRLVVEWEMSQAYKFDTIVGFVLESLGEDGCEGVNSVQLVVGDTMSSGRRVSRMARRSLSDSFPSRGGKASWASLKRRVIASGVMLDYFALGAGQGA
jgi:hypothetical protein